MPTDPAAKAAPKKGRSSGTAKRSPKAKPAPAQSDTPETIADGVQVEQVQPNAVIVYRQFGEDGKLQVQVGTLGDVRVTEAQTLLEQGVRQVRKLLELDS